MKTALRISALGAVTCLGLWAGPAPASATEARRIEVDDESPDQEKAPVTDADAWADDAPAGIDAPQLRNVEPRTRVYLDGSIAETPDLSALPQIAGAGRNLRLTAGGSLRWRRFQFDAELPASQATTVDLLDPNPAVVVREEDRHQTSLSIGDLRLGAQWTNRLPVDALPLSAGLGLRVRVPTHTTRFQFYDEVRRVTVVYPPPYYFHIEPALLVGGALGPLSFVMNQGALIFVGPDANLGDLPIVIPTLYFWDAHYALAWRLFRLLALSAEVNTTMQLNHVEGLDFQRINDVFAVAVAPGLQVHLGQIRVDLVARFGLTTGAELLGVLGYSGTRSLMLRGSWTFE